MKKKNSNYFIILINIILFLILLYSFRSNFISYFYNTTIVEVPSVINMNKDEAIKVLKNNKLDYDLIISSSNEVPINYVYLQKPEAGSKVKINRAIKLYINDENVDKVPKLSGLSFVEASRIIEENGLKLGRVDYIQADIDGIVLASYPKEETKLQYGQKINLLVSSTSLTKKDKMPDIIGLDVEQANAILAQIGLKISFVSETSDSQYPDNVIVKSFPEYGKDIDENTEISVVISKPKLSPEAQEEKIKQESIDEIIKKALKEKGE